MSDNGAQLPLYVHVYTAGCECLTQHLKQESLTGGGGGGFMHWPVDH